MLAIYHALKTLIVIAICSFPNLLNYIIPEWYNPSIYLQRVSIRLEALLLQV